MLIKKLGEIPPSVFKENLQEQFFSMPEEWIQTEVAQTLLERFKEKVWPNLIPLARPIDPSYTRDQKLNYAESLPKVMRVKTLRLDTPKAQKVWNSCEIETLIPPNQARRLCEMIYGKDLDPECGKQIVCYAEGDYFSPHNDHHPEFDHMKNGYIDFHFYICDEGVEAQYLVKEQNGHLNQMYPIGKPVGLNIYQLPFWHYTTPLMAKPNLKNKAVRWIIMYTFYFKEQPKTPLFPSQTITKRSPFNQKTQPLAKEQNQKSTQDKPWTSETHNKKQNFGQKPQKRSQNRNK